MESWSEHAITVRWSAVRLQLDIIAADIVLRTYDGTALDVLGMW